MIELTEEQRRELAGPEPRVFDPQTKATYVLVREDVYKRLTALFSEEDIFTTAEMLDRVMAEDDLHDAWLAQLQKQYGSQQA